MKQPLRILIVDDDQNMTHTLADILSLSGHAVEQADSGLRALDMINRLAFDCVLTDVRMPDMDGVEFYRQLRQSQPGLPVVLMSAYAADEIIQQGLNEGVVGVLDKPLDISLLLGFFSALARNCFIAIIDDDPAFCQTLGDILRKRGFNVTQIIDPRADMELIASNSQVILLDLKLKEFNGLDVLKGIRAHYPFLPVLLVTGYLQEMDEILRTARELNVYTCLYKPLQIPDLLEKLGRFQLVRLRSALHKK